MEHPKTKIANAKLKSSISAIENKKKSESHKKKSKSNAEIETLELKKRGVYVEKNKTFMFRRELDGADEMKEDIQVKPKRPHRGHKKFLAPVLTVLSKSSTGTQHHASFISKPKKDKYKHKVLPNHTLESIYLPSNALEIDFDKKRRYRSKILNDNKYQVDNFEVLQSKRERFRTSSHSSINDKEDTKWKSELPRLVPPAPDEIEDDYKYKTLIREVTEAKELVEKKTKVFDLDPPTLVAEQDTHRHDKQLYNFFVDLLESTFSVYNVKTEYDKAAAPSTVSSKIALEINESVARKLNVGTGMDNENKSQKPFDNSIRNKNYRNDDSLLHNIKYLHTPKRTIVCRESTKPAGKQTKARKEYEPRKLLSHRKQSYKYIRAEERPAFYKKNKKRDLLNMLKEELRMDPVSFEEPQNLYQALRVMAQQKRKTYREKTIRFNNRPKQNSEKCPAECKLLKGRRSVLNKKVCKRNENTLDHIAIDKNKSELGGQRKLLQQPYIIEELSNHSLKVYSFERFVPNSTRNRNTDNLKQMRRRMLNASYPQSNSNSSNEKIGNLDSRKRRSNKNI